MTVTNGETQTPAPVTLSDDSRVLALDWGEKRVGLALSDPLGFTAQGLATMSRRNRQRDFDFLRMLVHKHHVSMVLLGNPLQMSGAVGTQAARMKELAVVLAEQLGREVRLWDERLTSMEAHRILDQAHVIPSKRGESVDRMAAVLLLQNFLDSQAQLTRSIDERE